jgi:hypothetical protein
MYNKTGILYRVFPQKGLGDLERILPKVEICRPIGGCDGLHLEPYLHQNLPSSLLEDPNPFIKLGYVYELVGTLYVDGKGSQCW